MTENKRFKIADSHIIAGGKCIQDNQKKYTFPSVDHRYLLIGYLKALNELSEENGQLKQSYQILAYMFDKYKELKDSLENENEQLKKENKELKEENGQLKQELFESEKDYLIETYSDNPTMRDEKIQGLKEEFKERFGDD